MLRRLLLWPLIALIALYGIGEITAKPYAESKIESNVRARYQAAKDVEAHISTPALFDLITRSSIARIEIIIRHVEAGGVVADRISAVLTDVDLKLRESIRRGRMVVEAIDRVDVSVEILDDEFSKILPPGFTMQFGTGGATISGPAGTISGRLEVVSGSQLRFVPQDSGALPVAARSPVLGLRDLPMVTCLEAVTVLPGRARVRCSIEDPPTDFPPAGAKLFAGSWFTVG